MNWILVIVVWYNLQIGENSFTFTQRFSSKELCEQVRDKIIGNHKLKEGDVAECFDDRWISAPKER